ncbi:hypothetical protein ACHAPQ_011848, partial [Fusarium lateritium]
MKHYIPAVALFITGVLAVPTSVAQKCKLGEQYQSCGTACPLTCEYPEPQACTMQCVSGCFCKKGLIRNK